MANETASSCKREIQVEIPADVVAQETQSVLQKYSKLARLPGFRRGKVPVSIIRQRFSSEVQSEVVESLVPKYFQEEAGRQGLKPVSQPRVTDLHVHEGEPLRFRAEFEVLPEIDISGYQELRAEKPDTSISEDEVNATLDRLREQHATYASVEEDRPLQDGDYAQAELTGNPKEGEGQPVHMDEVLVEVGGANTLPEFSENLRGARVGETKTFDVKYPDDFSDRRLAGKGFTYSLAVKAIKRKQVPELNDDFAREVGTDFQTVEDLRKRIRESMQQEKQHEAEHQAKDKLIEQLVARHEFSVPESLVERQVDLRLERGLRALAAQGMRTEDMKKMDFGRLRAGQREQALREVKSALLLDKIADAEHIEVTDEELNQEIDAIAKQMKQTSEQVRSRLTREGALDRIRSRIRNEKTLDFLYRRSA